MDFLSCLPTEISEKILTFLSLKDILNCGLVCRFWYDLTNKNFVWKRFREEDVPLKECEVTKDFNWLLRPPCEWKLYFLSHKKVIYNWIKGKSKKYLINGRSIFTTAYDGKTLVINNNALDVYRIEKGNLVYFQKISYKNCKTYMFQTNTTYIVVKYESVIIVYKLIYDSYKIVYFFYLIDNSGKLICTNESTVMDEVSKQSRLYSLASTLIFLLGNTLFIYVPHFKIMYAWNIKDMIFLLEIKTEINDYLYDEERIYTCVNNNSIIAYNEKARICLSVTLDWNINKMYVNNHILLAVSDDSRDMKTCAWDKQTGNLLFNKNMFIPEDCLLHPIMDVIVEDKVVSSLRKKEIFAYNIYNNVVLWKTLTGEYCKIGFPRTIVSNRFLIFYNYTKHVFHLHDTKHGNFLYSLNGIDDYLFASYDVLIYAKNMSDTLVVKIYS